MSETFAETMQRFRQEAEERDRAKRAHTEFIDALVKAAYADDNGRPIGDAPGAQNRRDAFMEVVDCAVHYASTCLKAHEGSAGMRTKMRNKLTAALKKWAELQGRQLA
jgi:hypothetical protein